ncbi:hypothetical protein Q9966_016840 [Columba livia]|nr:hypothetical protein Q9966_016840 [Columba livia]
MGVTRGGVGVVSAGYKGDPRGPAHRSLRGGGGAKGSLPAWRTWRVWGCGGWSWGPCTPPWGNSRNSNTRNNSRNNSWNNTWKNSRNNIWHSWIPPWGRSVTCGSCWRRRRREGCGCWWI